jgi:hypothetical protein
MCSHGEGETFGRSGERGRAVWEEIAAMREISAPMKPSDPLEGKGD